MPFNERILTIVISCKEGIQECHLSNIEKVSEQAYETANAELSLCVPYTSVQVRSRLRRLNFTGRVVTLIETKKSFNQFQLQRALVVNVRTPYILFLDASLEAQDGAVRRLLEFITKKNPIKFSEEKIAGGELNPTAPLLIGTALVRQIEGGYLNSGLETETLAQWLKGRLVQDSVVSTEWGTEFSFASSPSSQGMCSE